MRLSYLKRLEMNGLTSNEFYQAMCYIKAKYPNWSVNIQDTFFLQVWFDDFEEIDYKQMISLCKSYCRANRFPPQSPFDLLEMIPKVYSVDEAWEKIIDIYHRSKSNEFFLNTILKEEPSLYPFVKGLNFFEIEKDGFGNSCIGYCIGKRFKREYKAYIDSQKIVYISNQLIQNNQLLLER